MIYAAFLERLIKESCEVLEESNRSTLKKIKIKII